MQSAINDAESRISSSTKTEAAKSSRTADPSTLKQNIGSSQSRVGGQETSEVHSGDPRSVKERFAQVGEGEAVDHDHVYLKPVVHVTKHIHEVEEITKVIERERHVHHVQVHEIVSFETLILSPTFGAT